MKTLPKSFKSRAIAVLLIGAAFGASLGVGSETPPRATENASRSDLALKTGSVQARTPDISIEEFEKYLNRLESERTAKQVRDILESKSWRSVIASAPPEMTAPPPPPPDAKEPPPPPTLPFRYVGKMEDPRGLKLFISWNDTDYSVSGGEILNDIYRVDSVQERQISFTYLPLGITQTLEIAAPE